MSAAQLRSISDGRPSLHGSRSFSRMPSSPPATSPRKRATTLQAAGIPTVPEARDINGLPEMTGKKADVFECQEDDMEASRESLPTNPEIKLPSTFDELPIEIKSLSERFLESLSAKVHPTPLTADALSEMFQDFYERAAAQIATHIATLASRIGREKSGRGPAKSTGRARAGSGANRSDSPASGGEMLTAAEVAHRKKARRLLELKRVALEEAVERGVCEKVYDRIFKHRSTDDDARDEKLRSRTAALAVVGIGLKELHGDSDPAKEDVRKTAEEKEDEIHASLAEAREALQRMDEEHYPAGKLQHLTAAHKSIVETLSSIFPSSSSADEVLPTLIYTLITSPPEGINVVSNLNFIQRFRASSKVDGEAAYCLVNLEAAISFIETVDLSSLRADELPEGPAKSGSRPTTPTTTDKEKLFPTQPAPAKTLKPTVSPLSATTPELSSSSPQNGASKPLPSPRTPTSMSTRPSIAHQRRLSSMVQAQADRIEASRENFLNAADKVYDSINGTLDNSLQFVFGRFKDQMPDSSPLPKTLEEARRLISSRDEEGDGLGGSGQSSPDPLSDAAGKDNKMLELLAGRQLVRDRSVDSTKSVGSGSGKRVAFTDGTAAGGKEKPKDAEPAMNLFNAINPLNRFQVPAFARFGRSTSGAAPPQASPTHDTATKKLADIVESPATITEPFPALEKQRTKDGDDEGGDDLNARETLAELRKLKPPKKRFLEVKDAGELRISEVEELLTEYRRLAKALGEAIAT